MLGCLRAAVVALIASAGITILLNVVFGGGAAVWENVNWQGLLLFAGAFGVLRKFRWSPILVMVLCGALGLVLGILF